MENNIFINQGFTKAIEEYLVNKDNLEASKNSSFLTFVIQALVFIYGELDIINPYRTNNPGGLEINIIKYGFSKESFLEFKEQLLNYSQNANKNSFLTIQKKLIDMFIAKKNHILISDEELEVFKSYLYFKEETDLNKKSLYDKLTPNSDEIMNYLNSRLFEQKHHFTITEYKDISLSKEAYQIAGFNPIEVMNMSEKEIENVNNKVFHFFRIKDTDINKRKHLESAIDYYKKYGNNLTSGNGYVDSLLLAGFIATGVMVLTIVAIKLAS